MQHSKSLLTLSFFVPYHDCGPTFCTGCGVGQSEQAWRKLGRIFDEKLNGPTTCDGRYQCECPSGELAALSPALLYPRKIEHEGCWSHISWLSVFQSYYEIWCSSHHHSGSNRRKMHQLSLETYPNNCLDRFRSSIAGMGLVDLQRDRGKQKRKLPKILVSRCLLGDFTAYHGGCSGPLLPGTPAHFLLCLVQASSPTRISGAFKRREIDAHDLSFDCIDQDQKTIGENANGATSRSIEQMRMRKPMSPLSRLLLPENLQTSKTDFRSLPALFHVVPLCPEVDLLGLPVPRPPLYLLREESLLFGTCSFGSCHTTNSAMGVRSLRKNQHLSSLFHCHQAKNEIKAVVKIRNIEKGSGRLNRSGAIDQKQCIHENGSLLFPPYNLHSDASVDHGRVDPRGSDAVTWWWEDRRRMCRGSTSQPVLLDFSKDSRDLLPFIITRSFSTSDGSSNDSACDRCPLVQKEEKKSSVFPFFHGAFLKAKSPSCGVGDARLYFSPPTNARTERNAKEKNRWYNKAELRAGNLGRRARANKDRNKGAIVEGTYLRYEEEEKSLLRFTVNSSCLRSDPLHSTQTEMLRFSSPGLSRSPRSGFSTASHASPACSSLSPPVPKTASPFTLTHGFFTTLVLQEEEKFSCAPCSAFSSPVPPLPVVSEKTLKTFLPPEEEQDGELEKGADGSGSILSPFTPSLSWVSLLTFLHQVSRRYCWENSFQSYDT